mmetsp:Transcript_25161/g.39993  ORF Transcript_25161/g.39993 Transcript_25161/m.39993 type:complete len:242 (-) Transcript_25161:231-956(-)
MAAYDDDNDNDIKQDTPNTDRWAYRSKYRRRNQPRHQAAFHEVTEEDAQQMIHELEQKNDQLLDGIAQTLHETTEVAVDTVEKLDGQRQQLLKVDKDLHAINEDLDESKGILNGMKSWTGFIAKKLKRERNTPPNVYVAPIAKKSAFHRNSKQRYLDKMKATNPKNDCETIAKSEYEMTDSVQYQKLDAIHQDVKILHEMANDICQELEEHHQIIDAIDDKMEPTMQRVKKQNKIMKKICN